MNVREWTIGRGSPHLIRVEHARFLSGWARVLLDGQEVWQRASKLYDTGFECRFEVDSLPCLVRSLYRTWHYEYEVWLDGKLQ